MTVFLQDTFTDTAGTLLSAHTPDIGNAWTASGKFLSASGTTTPTCSINASGQLVGSASGANQLYMNAVIPPAAEYTITSTWRAAALNISTAMWGMVARSGGTVGTPGNRYYFRYFGNTSTGSRRWEIGKYIGTTATVLSSMSEQPSASEHTVVVTVADATKKITVDGVDKCVTVDNAITEAGLIGTIGATGVTGAYMDALLVETAAAGGAHPWLGPGSSRPWSGSGAEPWVGAAA